jgi:hypothetical protein
MTRFSFISSGASPSLRKKGVKRIVLYLTNFIPFGGAPEEQEGSTTGNKKTPFLYETHVISSGDGVMYSACEQPLTIIRCFDKLESSKKNL